MDITERVRVRGAAHAQQRVRAARSAAQQNGSVVFAQAQEGYILQT